MTLEEAIRLLDPKTSGEAIAEIEYYNGFSGKIAAIQAITDACVIAVDAMRRQLPVKPTIYGDGCDDNGGIIFDSYDCPSCNVSYELDYDKYDCCPNCGQALDWSGEE